MIHICWKSNKYINH